MGSGMISVLTKRFHKPLKYCHGHHQERTCFMRKQLYTVPQIYFNSDHRGGFGDLQQLRKNNNVAREGLRHATQTVIIFIPCVLPILLLVLKCKKFLISQKREHHCISKGQNHSSPWTALSVHYPLPLKELLL